MHSTLRPIRRAFFTFLFGGASLTIGCRTELLIDSNPRGATVEVNGQRGVTPFTTKLPLTTFEHYYYSVEMEGYESTRGEIERETDLGAVLLSVAFPPALLFDVYRASSYTLIQLKPAKDFPGAFAHNEPWRPDLPPLPAGMMGPVLNRERATTRPGGGLDK